MIKQRITVASIDRDRLIEAFRALTKELSEGEPCRPGIRGHCGNPVCKYCRPETD